MQRRIALKVFTYSVIAVFAGIALQFILVNPTPDDIRGKFPWNVTADEQGHSNVFGLTLGKSTMGDGLARFMTDTEVSLFVSPDNDYVVEAFFKNINLAGLGANIILTADLSEEQLHLMYERGSRISTMGSGTRKVTLNYDDLTIARNAPIRTLTYLPKVNLDPEIIVKRFGEPQSKIVEEKDGESLEHWLYPSVGLDITVSKNRKEILQYISPKLFHELSQPLIQQTGQTEG